MNPYTLTAATIVAMTLEQLIDACETLLAGGVLPYNHGNPAQRMLYAYACACNRVAACDPDYATDEAVRMAVANHVACSMHAGEVAVKYAFSGRKTPDGEYRLTAYGITGKRLPDADYFTTCKHDACQTMLVEWRESRWIA